MSNDPKYRDESWLREQYVEKEMTTTEIAELCDCSQSTIGKWLNRFGVETRTNDKRVADERLTDSQWLREKYIEEKKSASLIADLCDCEVSTVSKWLKRAGIETRDNPKLPDQRLKDAKWLHSQYVEKEKTTTEIGRICDCGASTVGSWLKRHEIELRGGGRPVVDQRLRDPDWLREQYVVEQKTTIEIADLCDCSNVSVSKYLDEFGIESRSGPVPVDDRLKDPDWLRKRYVGDKKSTIEIAEECDCDNQTVRRKLIKNGIETRQTTPTPDARLKDREWLYGEYVDQGRNTYQIAEDCGCAKSTVLDWLRRHDIEVREPGGYLSGSDHPNWNEEAKHYGPGWNEAKKQAVRERDNRTCQDPRCSVTQSEQLEKFGQKLHVHHLRKARDVDDPKERNSKENLITLCAQCHQRWEKISDTGLVPQGVVGDD